MQRKVEISQEDIIFETKKVGSKIIRILLGTVLIVGFFLLTKNIFLLILLVLGFFVLENEKSTIIIAKESILLINGVFVSRKKKISLNEIIEIIAAKPQYSHYGNAKISFILSDKTVINWLFTGYYDGVYEELQEVFAKLDVKFKYGQIKRKSR